MENKTNQAIKGNNNVQQHVNNQVINQYNISGVTQQQVHAISTQTALEICREYCTLSSNQINQRLADFEEKTINRIANVEHSLNEFSNPSFVWQYKQAQIQAAITGDDNHYTLLCELLVHRINRKDNTYSQTGVDGAIKIVSELSDSTLSALTILCCILRSIHPRSPFIEEGLKTMDDLYGSIIKESILPTGYEWLDQLDILQAIRIDNISSFSKFSQIAAQIFDCYVSLGIKKESENYKKALELQEKIGETMLTINPLSPDYVKFSFSKNEISKLIITLNDKEIPLSSIPEIEQIFNLYDTENSALQNDVLAKFMTMFDSYHYLKMVHEWWDKINKACSLTSIGRVLGQANAQKCYPDFPNDID